MEVSGRGHETGEVRGGPWRRDGVNWALTGMRGVVIEGRKSRRGQSKETGLHPRKATEGSEKGALQSGAKRRSLCRDFLEGGGWGNTMGLGGM